MSAQALLEALSERRIALVSLGRDLLVDAPPGALTPELRAAIRRHKPELLTELAKRTVLSSEVRTRSPLVEYAVARAPKIRLTVRETRDIPGDVRLLNAIRRAIHEYQPGGNHIYVRIVTLDGRRFTVEWSALAERGLRNALASLLAADYRRRVDPARTVP